MTTYPTIPISVHLDPKGPPRVEALDESVCLDISGAEHADLVPMRTYCAVDPQNPVTVIRSDPVMASIRETRPDASVLFLKVAGSVVLFTDKGRALSAFDRSGDAIDYVVHDK